MTTKAAALDKWADVLSYVADPKFNLEDWDHCAAGHLCRDEFAIKGGLTTDPWGPAFMGETGMQAIAKFFGITLKQAADITCPSMYPYMETVGAKGRAHAIARIRALANYYRHPKTVAAPKYARAERPRQEWSPMMQVFAIPRPPRRAAMPVLVVAE